MIKMATDPFLPSSYVLQVLKAKKALTPISIATATPKI